MEPDYVFDLTNDDEDDVEEARALSVGLKEMYNVFNDDSNNDDSDSDVIYLSTLRCGFNPSLTAQDMAGLVANATNMMNNHDTTSYGCAALYARPTVADCPSTSKDHKGSENDNSTGKKRYLLRKNRKQVVPYVVPGQLRQYKRKYKPKSTKRKPDICKTQKKKR